MVQYFIWSTIAILVLSAHNNIEVNFKNLVNNVIFSGELNTSVDLLHFWFIPILVPIYLLIPFIKSGWDNRKEN